MIDEKKLREKLNELFHFRFGRKICNTYPNHKDEVSALIDEVIEASTITITGKVKRALKGK